jgi:proline dehydrogenase
MSVARNVLLAMSTNAWLRERATKTAFVRRSVSAFMPGESLEDAMRAAAVQERLGANTIFTKLGENVTRAEEAEEVTQHYLDVLDKVQAAGLRAQVSVKPTQLGLDLDKPMCVRNLLRLVDRATARNNFVWIDMESSPYVDPTIELFRRARERSPLVGLALQAYLYRRRSCRSAPRSGWSRARISSRRRSRFRRKPTSTRTSTSCRAEC